MIPNDHDVLIKSLFVLTYFEFTHMYIHVYKRHRLLIFTCELRALTAHRYLKS